MRANLVAGRLRVAATGSGDPTHAGQATTYGASRLGLVPHVVTQVHVPSADPKPQAPRHKRTFRLPDNVLSKLKAYSNVSHHYQCALVGEAISQYLEQAAATLGFQERSAMTKLQEQYGHRYDPPSPDGQSVDRHECHTPAEPTSQPAHVDSPAHDLALQYPLGTSESGEGPRDEHDDIPVDDIASIVAEAAGHNL